MVASSDADARALHLVHLNSMWEYDEGIRKEFAHQNLEPLSIPSF